MAFSTRITDDEMQYYQFKARQQFLIKREDHDWNEFCKKNKCSCCSCQPLNASVVQKDVGIQAILKPSTNNKIQSYTKSASNVTFQTTPKLVANFGRSSYVKRVEERALSKSIDDLKVELENLKIAVSDIQLSSSKSGKDITENNPAEYRVLRSDSAVRLLNQQRQNLIQTSLLNSLQRLQSSAALKMSKPVPLSSSKTKGFFLHPGLEKQRLVARNAYLLSLINKPNIKGKTSVKPLDIKKKKSTGKDKQSLNTFSKTKKKIAPTVTQKEEKTLIQSETANDMVDENIEQAVDGIIEDLLREEILDLNRIRHMKIWKQTSNSKNGQNVEKFAKRSNTVSQPSPETCAKIKEIPFFNALIKNPEKSSSIQNVSQSHLADSEFQIKNLNCTSYVNFQDQLDKQVNFQTLPACDREVQTEPVSLKQFRTLYTDSNLAKNVTRQRKLYFQYLERISRSRSHNFDPIVLSNMVAESLLDDCISDVSKELDDVPTSLIMDLYKQEFTSEL